MKCSEIRQAPALKPRGGCTLLSPDTRTHHGAATGPGPADSFILSPEGTNRGFWARIWGRGPKTGTNPGNSQARPSADMRVFLAAPPPTFTTGKTSVYLSDFTSSNRRPKPSREKNSQRRGLIKPKLICPNINQFPPAQAAIPERAKLASLHGTSWRNTFFRGLASRPTRKSWPGLSGTPFPDLTPPALLLAPICRAARSPHGGESQKSGSRPGRRPWLKPGS